MRGDVYGGERAGQRGAHPLEGEAVRAAGPADAKAQLVATVGGSVPEPLRAAKTPARCGWGGAGRSVLSEWTAACAAPVRARGRSRPGGV
ncbi:hypothetical protein ACFWV1_05840 [Streptomyces sp. NPDC058700]|uniref:hypothetical protein n=1 Tax=Streptomyces sp. NPDC058700 TaxID=3346607 RepID=UPI00365E7169